MDLPSSSFVKNLVTKSENWNCRYSAGFSGDTNSGKGPYQFLFIPELKNTAIDVRALLEGFASTRCSPLVYSSFDIIYTKTCMQQAQE